METTESIRAILQQNDWVASIDLKDAYFHIPVAKKHQKYLRFTHRGAVYQYVALPFGLSTAPMIFTLVMREVRIMLHKINVEIHMYLDDWLLRAKSQVLLQRNLNVTLDLCEQLGLEVNVAKSELIPTQKFTFLGISVQHQLRHGLPTSNPSRGPDYISMPGSKTETNCKENDEPSGTHVLSRESHPMGKTAYERTAGRPAWSMAPGRITGKPDCPDTTFQSRLTMVEGRFKLVAGFHCTPQPLR